MDKEKIQITNIRMGEIYRVNKGYMSSFLINRPQINFK